MHRGSRSTLVVALLAAAAALVVLIWGAGSGDPLVQSPQGTWGEPRSTGGWWPTPPDFSVEPAPTGTGRAKPSDGTNLTIDLALGLFLMAVLTAVLILAKWASRQRIEQKMRDAIAAEDELVALLEATNDDVRYQALSEGDPRNGVVACWVALEEAVQRSGLERDRSETAAELTRRVLSRWEVDQQAITDLSEAYREARFSRHPVTEEQRQGAVDALDRIHADLRRRVQAEEEARAAAEADTVEAADGADDTTGGEPATRRGRR